MRILVSQIIFSLAIGGWLIAKSSGVKRSSQGKYNYGKYGSNFSKNASKIRKDLEIPDNWVPKASKKDEGIKFIDPNDSRNHIRVMPGKTESKFPNSQNPYTIRYKKGSPVDKAGEKIPNPTGQKQNKSSDLHVPVTEFKF